MFCRSIAGKECANVIGTYFVDLNLHFLHWISRRTGNFRTSIDVSEGSLASFQMSDLATIIDMEATVFRDMCQMFLLAVLVITERMITYLQNWSVDDDREVSYCFTKNMYSFRRIISVKV